MKGLVRKAAAALCCLAGVGGLGCYTYRDLVDPCYPERYNYQARQEVVASYTPQELNGHVLDQTVWNYDFETGTDKLTGGGLEHLAYLARRRPQPDTVVYLQTAQDVAYDPDHSEKLGEVRQNLDARRVVAVERFLTAQTGGRRGEFQVLIHDPSEVGAPGAYGSGEYSQVIGRVKGGLGTGAGAAASANNAAAANGASAPPAP